MNKCYAGSVMFLVTLFLVQVGIFPLGMARAQESVPDPEPVRQEITMQTGWVDAVSEEEVIIDDLASPLSAVMVYDQNGFALKASSLVAGQYVAFKRGGGKIEIHLLAGKGERPQSSRQATMSEADGEDKNVIRQVDGVWKN